MLGQAGFTSTGLRNLGSTNWLVEACALTVGPPRNRLCIFFGLNNNRIANRCSQVYSVLIDGAFLHADTIEDQAYPKIPGLGFARLSCCKTFLFVSVVKVA